KPGRVRGRDRPLAGRKHAADELLAADQRLRDLDGAGDVRLLDGELVTRPQLEGAGRVRSPRGGDRAAGDCDGRERDQDEAPHTGCLKSLTIFGPAMP